MKLVFSELLSLIAKKQERNVRILLKFFLVLIAMITLYSVLFHFLMILENRELSWITGFYWTLTVMSYASLAANTILNLLKPDEVLMLAEGLNVFRVGVHAALVGRSLADSQIRKLTGCNIVAVYDRGKMHINPEPTFRFGENNELILIGSGEAEAQFFKMNSEMSKID